VRWGNKLLWSYWHDTAHGIRAHAQYDCQRIVRPVRVSGTEAFMPNFYPFLTIMVSVFAPLLAAVGIVASSSWALGGNLFRSFLRRYYWQVNLVMGALLIYTAAASLLSSHA
jgi:hypothetical protein